MTGSVTKEVNTNSLSARKMRGEAIDLDCSRNRAWWRRPVVELARRARKKEKKGKKEKKRGEAETRPENASQSERECFLRGSAMVKVLVYKQLLVVQLSV